MKISAFKGTLLTENFFEREFLIQALICKTDSQFPSLKLHLDKIVNFNLIDKLDFF